MLLYKELTKEIVDAAYTVHNQLGYGFLEKVYEKALSHELELRNMSFKNQNCIEVRYKDCIVGNYIADIVVENKVLLELKACDEISKVHIAQTLNYLKATNIKVGLLINFGNEKIQIKRLVK